MEDLLGWQDVDDEWYDAFRYQHANCQCSDNADGVNEWPVKRKLNAAYCLGLKFDLK